MMLSIVIPTYRRGHVLADTIKYLLPLCRQLDVSSELLVLDQTEQHDSSIEHSLQAWNQSKEIRWLRLTQPHLTAAMNFGLLSAQGDIVLYLDDDIIPSKDLLHSHLKAHQCFSDAWAVVGQVLQPGQLPVPSEGSASKSHFWRDLDFPFNSTKGSWIENAIGCNLSVKRNQALTIGGFDENFPPPVASRFESEFAKRLIRSGGLIRFEPSASIHHLASSSGGTRSRGSHLTSASPRYGIGDCYFALRCADGLQLFWYLFRKPFREVRTKFHLSHPWWIPVKLVGEIRALIQALCLARRPPSLIVRSR